MILVTGAAGFIASCLCQKLLSNSKTEKLYIADDFTEESKSMNLPVDDRVTRIPRNKLFEYLEAESPSLKAIYHLGARTDTSEKDVDLFDRLNVNYTKKLWNYATKNQIAFLYASSASTYGDGSLGFSDDHDLIAQLKPLNPYADSKQIFDLWALSQIDTPPQWAGVKFFNVYGPNEYHKARMASVVLHTFRQIKATQQMKLFRSHREGIADGHQSRDFIYVEDAINCCEFLLNQKVDSGIYNIGTGIARSFLDLSRATFQAMGVEENISFIDTPIDIRENYQYYTCAENDKIRKAGYDKDFHTLEEGVEKYVKNYLLKGSYY